MSDFWLPGTVFQISKRAQIAPKWAQNHPFSLYRPNFYTPSRTGQTWKTTPQIRGEFKMVLFLSFRAKNTPKQSLQVVYRDHCFGKLSKTFHFFRILLILKNQKACPTWDKKDPPRLRRVWILRFPFESFSQRLTTFLYRNGCKLHKFTKH